VSSDEIKGPDERFVCYPSKGKPSFHTTLEQAKQRAEAELSTGSASAIVYELTQVAAVRAIRHEWFDV
jgi:hypothetical protein